ncbi:TetR/AcrR family transcriptional regulator [Gordonia araii]|uniref:TetR/AcrR family transcriptional regulator n=1 Tax=Gordonia araii TaxID=263909 RepID=UPI0002F5231F|nr:TetR/AcrR family transcriptional regulator [Gordonia araii]NNG98322.1 TetR/AcrR family transcriptional regulator [Gordonia araii NBRC 100433]
MTDADPADTGAALTPEQVLAIISGSEKRAALPRHRHGLTPEQVEESQRWRLIAATAEVIARQGFAQTSVEQIAAEAGVSKKSFYKYFADKEAAFISAYDAIGLVVAHMSAGIPADPRDIDELLSPLISGYLTTLQAAPAFTTMLLLRAQGATLAINERRIQGVASYAAAIGQILERGREQGIAIADVSEAELIAMLGGINELCIRQVHRHGVDGLDEIVEPIHSFARRVLAP